MFMLCCVDISFSNFSYCFPYLHHTFPTHNPKIQNFGASHGIHFLISLDFYRINDLIAQTINKR